jgi:hypothetical protein
MAYLFTFVIGFVIFLIAWVAADCEGDIYGTKKKRARQLLSIGVWCFSIVLWVSLFCNVVSWNIDADNDGIRENWWNLTETLILLGSSVALVVANELTKNKDLYLKYNNKKKIRKANVKIGDLVSYICEDSYYNHEGIWNSYLFSGSNTIKEIKVIKTKSELQWEEDIKDMKITSSDDIILTLI